MTKKIDNSRYIEVSLGDVPFRTYQSLMDRVYREVDKTRRGQLDEMGCGSIVPVKVLRKSKPGSNDVFSFEYVANWPIFDFKKVFRCTQTKTRSPIEALRIVLDTAFQAWNDLCEERGRPTYDSAPSTEEGDIGVASVPVKASGVDFSGVAPKSGLPMISDVEVLRFLRDFEPKTSVEVYGLRFLMCYSVEQMSELLGVDQSTINRMEKTGKLSNGQISSVRGGLLRHPDVHHIVDLYQTYGHMGWFEYLEGVNSSNWPKSYLPTCKVCHSDDIEIRPDLKYVFHARCCECGEERVSYKMSEIRYYLLHLLRVKVDLRDPIYYDFKLFQKHMTHLKKAKLI